VVTKPAPRRPAKKLEPYTEAILGTTVTFEMVPIPAGTVKIADPAKPGSVREVKIPALWFGKTELTWDAYDVFAFRLDLPEGQAVGPDAIARPTKPYGVPDGGFGHRGFPAMNVTYHSAAEFCRWLSAKTGRRYRLPTEAEWEYACGAGALASGPVAGAEALGKMAWHWDNAEEMTHAVGQKQANAWGIHDMLGNVAEWCAGLDGKPVVRGGSYNDAPDRVFPGARQVESPDWQMSDPNNPKSKWWLTDGSFIGFRVVREEQPGQ